jgi:hypothetical protein
MILITHISIALTSLILAGIVYFYPSQNKLRINYIFVALTFISGFYLVFTKKPDHMASVCITGLVYLGLAMFGILSARHKLQEQVNK